MQAKRNKKKTYDKIGMSKQFFVHYIPRMNIKIISITDAIAKIQQNNIEIIACVSEPQI